MGRWEKGNFDDDVARDYLADVIARFERFIERILSGDIPEEAMGLDNMMDAGEHCLLPTVEMISVLHEALGSDYLPSPETVARWAEVYPRLIEPMLKNLDPSGCDQWYLSERRPVVQATFERLLKQSQALVNIVQVDPDQGATTDRPRD
jgi:hypothetical protein